jgi:hypothetical protein
MASLIASVSQGIIPTTLGLPISQITAAPQLTHQRELLRRVETIDSATCGWVNGDYSEDCFLSFLQTLKSSLTLGIR